MTTIHPLGSFGSDYKYTVTFARYQDKWLFCRKRGEDSWRGAGGHVEAGETPLEAAKRELVEETGAVKFDIMPVCDYMSTDPAQLYFAHIHELGELDPNFEMEAVGLFDGMPDKCRFPHILPVLYEYLQGWLNVNMYPDELWDIYDADRNLTGRTHRRADPLAEGDYHLVVNAVVMNAKGEFLITQRAPNKGFPLTWEIPGGSAKAGEDSLTAAVTELLEETGIVADTSNAEVVVSFTHRDAHFDAWLFRQEFDLADVVLCEGETVDAKSATAADLRALQANGQTCITWFEELFMALGV